MSTLIQLIHAYAEAHHKAQDMESQPHHEAAAKAAIKAVENALPVWRPMESAPSKSAESEAFLILRRGVVIQVSWFEGRLYPDAREACIDWEDGITDAEKWQPLPEAPV